MGNRFSTPKKDDPETEFTILEIDENATAQEIKEQYHRLLIKYHPNMNKGQGQDHYLKIREAYKKLEQSNFKLPKKRMFKKVDFSKITKKHLQSLDEDLFFAEVNNLYMSIVNNEKLYVPNAFFPSFGDKNSKCFDVFYSFFSAFKTNLIFENNYTGPDKRYYEKKYNKIEQKEYSMKIREFTKLVKSLDPRIKAVKPIVVKEYQYVAKPVKVKKKKDLSKYNFYCDICEKGFMGNATAIQHFKSVKHKNKLKVIYEIEDDDAINSQIEEVINELKRMKISEKADEKEDIIENSIKQNVAENDEKNENIDEVGSDLFKRNNVVRENIEEQVEENVFLHMDKKKEEVTLNVNKSFDNIEKDKENVEDKFKEINEVTNEEKKQNTQAVIKQKSEKKGGKAKKDAKKLKKIKMPKKKTNFQSKESYQSLTCAQCNTTFSSRNKLFEHIRSSHISKNK